MRYDTKDLKSAVAAGSGLNELIALLGRVPVTVAGGTRQTKSRTPILILPH